MEEQALCRKIAHGSQRALEEAIRRYSAYVVTVIHNRSRGCLSPEDEEELASDTFFALWNHAGDIHGGSLRAWLGAVARNATVSRLRSLSPTVPLEEDIEDVAAPGEEGRALWEAVQALPGKYRAVLHLFYYEDLSAEEIGRLLGEKSATVRTRLTRARRLLKQRLEEDGL